MTAEERIVAWLSAARGPLSGEELGRRLGCSRAGVQLVAIGALTHSAPAVDLNLKIEPLP